MVLPCAIQQEGWLVNYYVCSHLPWWLFLKVKKTMKYKRSELIQAIEAVVTVPLNSPERGLQNCLRKWPAQWDQCTKRNILRGINGN